MLLAEEITFTHVTGQLFPSHWATGQDEASHFRNKATGQMSFYGNQTLIDSHHCLLSSSLGGHWK